MKQIKSMLGNEYYVFEMGLSGTGLTTAEWPVSAETNPLTVSNIRDIISVIVNGLELDKEENRMSQKYFKVRGSDGSVQWTTTLIQSKNPDIQSCALPTPFKVNDSE